MAPADLLEESGSARYNLTITTHPCRDAYPGASRLCCIFAVVEIMSDRECLRKTFGRLKFKGLWSHASMLPTLVRAPAVLVTPSNQLAEPCPSRRLGRRRYILPPKDHPDEPCWPFTFCVPSRGHVPTPRACLAAPNKRHP